MNGHLIQIDKENRQISIFRVRSGKTAELFTHYSFDRARTAGFGAFAKQLGEDLILDSPDLRELLLE
jgi:hypothetical protein